MINIAQLAEFVKSSLAAINSGLAGGCYRLRSAQFSGEVVLENGTVVQQTVTTTPTGETISTVTETPSVQVTESTDSMEATTANGGDKIHGSTTTVTEI